MPRVGSRRGRQPKKPYLANITETLNTAPCGTQLIRIVCNHKQMSPKMQKQFRKI